MQKRRPVWRPKKKQLVKEIIREEEKEKQRVEAEKRAQEEADHRRIEEEEKEEVGRREKIQAERGQLEELQIPLPAEKKMSQKPSRTLV